jgi:hypothetical protein
VERWGAHLKRAGIRGLQNAVPIPTQDCGLALEEGPRERGEELLAEDARGSRCINRGQEHLSKVRENGTHHSAAPVVVGDQLRLRAAAGLDGDPSACSRVICSTRR